MLEQKEIKLNHVQETDPTVTHTGIIGKWPLLEHDPGFNPFPHTHAL